MLSGGMSTEFCATLRLAHKARCLPPPVAYMASLWACTGMSGWCGDFIYSGVPIDALYDWISYTPLPWHVHLPLVYRSEASPAPPCWLIEDFKSMADKWRAEMGNGATCKNGLTNWTFMRQAVQLRMKTTDLVGDRPNRPISR